MFALARPSCKTDEARQFVASVSQWADTPDLVEKPGAPPHQTPQYSEAATWPHGGSDFFNSTVTSDVSAATSGAILQAAIANNINMIARDNALTLAARKV